MAREAVSTADDTSPLHGVSRRLAERQVQTPPWCLEYWPGGHTMAGLAHGVVWCGVVWCGVVWCGVVWCGVVWCGVVWCGVVWCGVVWCGVVWCGVVWCAQKAMAGMVLHMGNARQEGCVCRCALCVVCCAPVQRPALSLCPAGCGVVWFAEGTVTKRQGPGWSCMRVMQAGRAACLNACRV